MQLWRANSMAERMCRSWMGVGSRNERTGGVWKRKMYEEAASAANDPVPPTPTKLQETTSNITSPRLPEMTILQVDLSHLTLINKVESSNINQAALHTLPVDIVLDIFYTLDIPSILKLRQTCRRICDISRAYSVWATAFKRSTQALPFRYHLDRPLKSFSAMAVETMVTNMAKLDMNWTSDHPRPTSIRELPGPHAAPLISKLLPGGRWLLTALNDGSGRVLVYDLDTPGMNPYTLVGLDDLTSQREPLRLTVSIHADEDIMVFDFAVLYRKREDSTSPLRLRASIWRITLDPDEVTFPFKPRHSKFFDIRPFGAAKSISMRDELFLRTSDNDRNFQLRFDVFQWSQCSLTQHRRASFMTTDLECVYSESYLLPHNRLLCIVQSLLLVYEIPEMKDIDNLEDAVTPFVAQPHWVFDFGRPGSPILAISPPDPWSHTSTEYTSVTFANDRNIYIVLIPADRSASIHREHTINLDVKSHMGRTMSAGHYRGIWMHKYSTVAGALTFAPGNRGAEATMWRSNTPYKLERLLKVVERWAGYKPLFDEQSGRLIYNAKRGVDVVVSLVIDFV